MNILFLKIAKIMTTLSIHCEFIVKVTEIFIESNQYFLDQSYSIYLLPVITSVCKSLYLESTIPMQDPGS